MATISQALLALRPGAIWAVTNNTYSGIEWLDQVQIKPTEQEVNDKMAEIDQQQPFVDCKNEAKRRISLTDWSVLPDVGLANVAAYESYRATLRAWIKNPVVDPVWPVEPEPVWA